MELTDLLEEMRLLAAIDSGQIPASEIAFRPRVVASRNGRAVFVVSHGFHGDTAAWEQVETPDDRKMFEQEISQFWAAQGIDPRPAPAPEPIVTKWDEPAPPKPKPKSIIRRVLRR